MLLQDFISYKDQFLTHIAVEKNLAANTRRAYASDLEQFADFWKKANDTAGTPIGFQLTLERFFVSLYHQKITKPSIARKISCLTSLQTFLRISGIELTFKIARPRLEKKLPIFLSVDEIFYLLDQVPDDKLRSSRPLRDKAILELLYATGIRCSELVAINFGDIDFEQKVIRIKGKGRKERLALFNDAAKTRLIKYLKNEREPLRAQDPMFMSVRNTRLTTRAVQKIMELFRGPLKTMRPVTPHKIRHSFATHLLSQGVDLRMIQELLGHQSLSSTEKYTHVSPEQLARMVDSLHPLNRKK